MKLASFTDNSQSFLKYGDTNTFLHVQISEDGTFVDLTQALAVNVPVANDDGLLFTKTIDPTKLANGDSGIVDINFTSDDQNNLPPDDYYLEIWVTNHDGTIGIYPADENQLMFTITDNLTLITGDVVPAVAFDDFQNMFNTLQQQVHDAIANGLKGEAGAKGNPGEGLDIKGRVDSVSALPTAASEGDGYLVNEELYVYTSGAWKDCGPIQGPQGIQGIQGKTGNGISSTTIQYQISNNATTAPTGAWSNSLIATTQVNPFLWTQVTLNYDDGTSKSFYLVSSKGDKGDKGDTGATGPVGPVGPVGAGLVVKGTVNNVSQLPKTGNQEGYCYFIGTDLYVWDAGAWKNCGSVSPDLSKYTTVTDLNNGLSTKVTDNKNGTEQLNGVKVQPFNKLSDTIGGRNLVKDSEQEFTGKAYDIHDYKLASITELAPGKTYTMSFSAKVDDKAVNCNQYLFVDIHESSWKFFLSARVPISTDYQRVTNTFTVPESQTGISYITAYMNHPVINGKSDSSADKSADAGTGYIKEFKLEQGSVATDWTPAPEDKADDSKVVQLQTQVDNSAVGTNLVLGTSGPFIMWYGALNTAWNADKKHSEISLPSMSSPTEVLPKDPSFYLNVTPGIPYTQSIYVSTDAPLTGKAMQVSWFTATHGHNTKGKDDISSISKNVYRITSTQTWPTSSTDANIRLFDLLNFGLVFDLAKGTFLYFYQPKIELGSHATDWCPNPEDKVNVSDMRKPASDVAGIEEVNAKQDKIGYTPADDAKVAHLSGANNFDTVPTVNNNPLLLASSLPSDLARTGSDQEFTGKNTFDTAPIDKKTGNPYITKDGVPAVPSTLADTTKLSNFTAGLQSNGTAVATQTDVTTAISTATENMVDSTKATNFTAGLQSGGVDVATAADLKSVEDSAWRQLDNKHIIPSKYTLSPATNILYKIDDSNHKLYLSGSIVLTNNSYTDKVPVTIQLDSIVKSILTVLVPYFGDDYNGGYIKPAFATASPESLTINAILGRSSISAIGGTEGSLAFVTYDKLV